MAYLDEIYSEGKASGFYLKYENATAFKNYFSNVGACRKLWEFLKTKNNDAPDFEDFLRKILYENIKKRTKYNQPVAAVEDIEFGTSEINKIPDLIKIGTLKFPGSNQTTPAFIPFVDSKGVTLVAKNIDQILLANNCIQKIGYRLLCSIPLHLIKFIIIDAEKSGMNFNWLLGLDKKNLEPKIWNDERQIEENLAIIKSEIPAIFTKYLQAKYDSIAEYNAKVTNATQPYKFIFIANFPKGFNNNSIEKLVSIIDNGSKAGIYFLITVDKSIKIANENVIATILKFTTVIDLECNELKNIPNSDLFNQKFFICEIDSNIPVNLEMLKNQINKAASEVKINRVNISIDHDNEWAYDSTKGIIIPVGITEANENLNFTFGHNSDVYHALIGGATGSGKSVLLHNIIINGSLLYSPNDLQFIILDFKEGTEFKIYEQLSSVKILSIAGEVLYGLSVLEFLHDEILKRGNLFKEFDAGNLEDYNTVSGKKMHRYVMIIDEFQVLLSGRGIVSSKASYLIEDISRRGRAFGIHMILSTQSLGDVDISSATLSNIGLRIGMKMTEMDCARILDINNNIATHFTNAGRAVYNIQNGKKNGNIVFQASFIDKKTINDRISNLNTKIANSNYITPFKKFIYDGGTHASVLNNSAFQELIKNNKRKISENFCDVYIGEPSYLQEEHCKIRFRKQAASNMLIVGDDTDFVIGTVYHALFQIMLCSSPESQFYIFDLFDIDSGLQGRFSNLKQFNSNCKIFPKDRPLDTVMDALIQELENRFDDETRRGRFVLAILNAQRIRNLRKESYDLTPLAAKLSRILKDGPDYGIHTIINMLTYNNLNDVFESKTLSEFENTIILKGEDPAIYTEKGNFETVKKNGLAYLKSPNTRYDLDSVKLYCQ